MYGYTETTPGTLGPQFLLLCVWTCHWGGGALIQYIWQVTLAVIKSESKNTASKVMFFFSSCHPYILKSFTKSFIKFKHICATSQMHRVVNLRVSPHGRVANGSVDSGMRRCTKWNDVWFIPCLAAPWIKVWPSHESLLLMQTLRLIPRLLIQNLFLIRSSNELYEH